MESASNFRTPRSTSGPHVTLLEDSSQPAAAFHLVQPAAFDQDAECWGSARFLPETPRWLLLVALIYAPWAYGSTRAWTITTLDWLLGLILAGWTVSCAVQRQWPRVHPVLLLSIGWLLFQGWWMTLNAKFVFDTTFNAVPLKAFAPWAPGTVNEAVSWPNIVNLSFMLGIACFACDLGRRSVWRKRLWLVAALTGVSLIGLGLIQKVSHAPGIFWKNEQFGQTFFATYRYHANAGSFMNIVWPIVAAWLILALRKPRALAEKILWCLALALCLTGVFANTSRASSLIALLMLMTWAGWTLFKAIRGRLDAFAPAQIVGVTLASATLLLLVVGFGGLDMAWKRWSDVNKQFSASNPRLLAAQVCVEMLPHAGWFGFGPGTFRTAFPFFNKHTGPETRGVWIYAHEDYLQTLVEWGWMGTAPFAVVIFGGIGKALRFLARNRRRLSDRDHALALAGVGGMLAVLIHALGDFPFQVPSIQLYAAVFVGLFWSCGSTWGKHRNQASSPG